METEQSNDKLQTSQHSRSHSRWIGEQLTIIAEAMGEAISPERLKIYAGDLADLDRLQLDRAFARARRECRFFPKIAELRDLAGAAAKDERAVEAEAAWTFANDYLRRWGVDLLPIWSGGKETRAPAIPSRIDYALRRIGGLRGLNQVTAENRPFMFKDFCEAYNLAPIADAMAPKVRAKFPIADGQVKKLSNGVKVQPLPERERAEPHAKPKPMSTTQLPTDARLRDRREMLRQQTDYVVRQLETERPGANHPIPLNGGKREMART